MKRYFVVGSSGQPYEVSAKNYLQYKAMDYITTYEVGSDDVINVTSLTKESEDDAFPK